MIPHFWFAKENALPPYKDNTFIGIGIKGNIEAQGVLTYLAEQGCAALMGRFFTRNP